MKLSRRNILSAGLAGTLGSLSVVSSAAPAKRALRIAYLTDIHLPAIDIIRDRAAKALQRASKSDVVFFGGDNLMGIDHVAEDAVTAQFKSWESLISKHLKKPYFCILGNHDIEQWDDSDLTYYSGKKRAIQILNMKDRYWSFEKSGWKFIGLDTVQRNGQTFKGEIDPEQLSWLGSQLKNRNEHVVVMGHMPILSVTALAGANMKPVDGVLRVQTTSYVANGAAVAKVIREAGNVRAVLSGHTHMIDRCDFGGTSYICAGAVSGGWWNGANEGFYPSLFEFDLMTDGTFTSRAVEYEL